jgi:hypothetical protein
MSGSPDSASPTPSVGDRPPLAAWQLPLIVSAIAVSIVGGFYLGGPGLGMAVGALAASAIVVMAVRNPPRGAISPAHAPDSRPRVLVVLEAALGDRGAEAIAAVVVAGAALIGEPTELLLIAPCRSRFLARWACDLAAGRQRAQETLVHSGAVLAKAGLDLTARVGDEDVVQMTEDVLGSFAATEVVLVSDEPRGRNAEELRTRLTIPLWNVSGDGQLSVARREGVRATLLTAS